MFLGNLALAFLCKEVSYFHESGEIDTTKLFQFLDFIHNFVQFLLNSSFDSVIKLFVLWKSFDFIFQFAYLILQLLTDITLKCINLIIN